MHYVNCERAPGDRRVRGGEGERVTTALRVVGISRWSRHPIGHVTRSGRYVNVNVTLRTGIYVEDNVSELEHRRTE